MSSTVEDLGRRERKKLETRRALRAAALRLAVEKGPEQLTIEEIADAADVSVRTFFNYFPGKDEAIVGWDEESRAVMAQRLLDRPAEEPPLLAMRNFVHQMLEHAEEWADQRATLHRLVHDHPVLLPTFLGAYHELERMLLGAMVTRLGLVPGESFYPVLVVSVGVQAMRLALSWWEEHGRTTPLPRLVDEAFDTLQRGLTPA